MTDNNGELQVWHRLGTQAGPAANAIRFSHPSIPEEAIFTATSQPGPVAILNGDMGLFQNVQTQSQPLELLTAVVRDKALNPLSGVAVEFFVKSGQAYFAPEEGVMITDMNGKTGQKITLKTDKNGLVAVRPYIGEEEGLVEIQAKLATISGSASNASNTATPVLAGVIYKLQAKAAKDGPTGFSGRVFDDKGLPIAGVTLSIARTFKIDYLVTEYDGCCAGVKSENNTTQQFSPIIELSTPDLPILGHSFVWPRAVEIGLFTKLKVAIGGVISLQYRETCTPKFMDVKGLFTGSFAVEGTLKAEAPDVVKLNFITVGGGGGVKVYVLKPADQEANINFNAFVYAKSEVQLVNWKVGFIDFYQSTDTNSSIPLITFVD